MVEVDRVLVAVESLSQQLASSGVPDAIRIRKVSNIIGVHVGTLRQWMNGEKRPSLVGISALENAATVACELGLDHLADVVPMHGVCAVKKQARP